MPDVVHDTPPEKRLLIEILKSAVRDIVNFGRGKRSVEAHHRRNALHWLRSTEPNSDVHFGFVELCEDLNLDAEDVRRRILAAIDSNTADGLFERKTRMSPAIDRLRKMARRPREPVRKIGMPERVQEE